ncbi:MAG: RQC domain-containing protein [Candidatus Helarchaeota archaeon]
MKNLSAYFRTTRPKRDYYSGENLLELARALLKKWKSLRVTYREAKAFLNLCFKLGVHQQIADLKSIQKYQIFLFGWFYQLELSIYRYAAYFDKKVFLLILENLSVILKKMKINSFSKSLFYQLYSSKFIKKLHYSPSFRAFLKSFNFIESKCMYIEDFDTICAELQQSLHLVLEKLKRPQPTFTKFSRILNRTKSQLERSYFQNFSHSHYLFMLSVRWHVSELYELQKNLLSLNAEMNYWSPTFRFFYEQLWRKINHYRDTIPKFSKNHVLNAFSCSCGFDFAHLDNFERKVDSMKSEIETKIKGLKKLSEKIRLTQGEIIYEPIFIILETLSKVNDLVGRNALKLILKGSKSRLATLYNFERIKNYGKLAHLSHETLKFYIDQAIQQGFIKIRLQGRRNYPYLYISPLGKKLMEMSPNRCSRDHIMKYGTIDHVIALYHSTNDRIQILRQIIEYARFDVIERMLISSKGYEANLLLSVIGQFPREELIPLLISQLLSEETPITKQRLIIRSLAFFLDHFPNSDLKSILAGFLMWDDGILKKEIQRILER